MFVSQIESFYRNNNQALFTYALSLTRNSTSAEDAVHTALAGILRRGQTPADMRPYIFKCVRNAAMDSWRKERKRTDSIFELRTLKSNDVEDKNNKVDIEQLNSYLEKLSDNERETIILKIYDELTFEEISEVTGASKNTTASWYRRGIEKLRKMMKEANDEKI